MYDITSGIIVIVSLDGKSFTFNAKDIIQTPLSAFTPYYIGFDKISDNINIIKLSLLSSIIKTYFLLSTGKPIYAMSDYTIQEETKDDNDSMMYIDFCKDDDDEIFKFLEDENVFQDFTEFVENSNFDFMDIT